MHNMKRFLFLFLIAAMAIGAPFTRQWRRIPPRPSKNPSPWFRWRVTTPSWATSIISATLADNPQLGDELGRIAQAFHEESGAGRARQIPTVGRGAATSREKKSPVMRFFPSPIWTNWAKSWSRSSASPRIWATASIKFRAKTISLRMFVKEGKGWAVPGRQAGKTDESARRSSRRSSAVWKSSIKSPCG